MANKRAVIPDLISSMLQVEVGNRCPLCGVFERTGNEFTDHHINHDPSISEFWNLIQICQPCHDDLTKNKNDGTRLKRVRQIKLRLFRNYFGPEAYKALYLAYKNNLVTATPITALELVRRGYLKMYTENILTVGPATNVSTFDTYTITVPGKEIVEKLGIDIINAPAV